MKVVAAVEKFGFDKRKLNTALVEKSPGFSGAFTPVSPTVK